jgi:alkaline phosphatase D
LNEPFTSERRKKGQGLYISYSFGDKSSYKTVRIILLDVRFYSTNQEGHDDILGSQQWKWLEETLVKANETFIFIGSGTQILPFNRILTENWEKHSREKLFDILGRVKKDGIILLSGDVHTGQMLKTPCILPGIY